MEKGGEIRGGSLKITYRVETMRYANKLQGSRNGKNKTKKTVYRKKEVDRRRGGVNPKMVLTLLLRGGVRRAKLAPAAEEE